MRILLVRHAEAEPGHRADGLDAARGLTDTGRRQAAAIATAMAALLDEGLHQLFASPKVRAWETAAPLAGWLPPGRQVVPLASLAGGDPEDVVADLRAVLRPASDEVVACVGHQPDLGFLASYLTGTDPERWPARVAKASVMELTGDLARGGMRVEALLPNRYLACMAPAGDGSE
ncbi:MAG: histidine phosphatase family protein [Trueperaceae bacterium]